MFLSKHAVQLTLQSTYVHCPITIIYVHNLILSPLLTGDDVITGGRVSRSRPEANKAYDKEYELMSWLILILMES